MFFAKRKRKAEVFVQVCDTKYLFYAKYLFANAKVQGKWNGDYCLIANNVDKKDLRFFSKNGIYIFNAFSDNPYYSKLELFNEYFKQWTNVLYLDQDCVIYDNMSSLSKPSINQILMTQEPWSINKYFASGKSDEEWGAAIASLLPDYPFLENRGYSSSYLYFNTSIINNNTLSELINLKNKLASINTHGHNKVGGDQPIINLYFYNKIIHSNNCLYWKDEQSPIHHFCHWQAPWINNNYSPSLQKTYFQHYIECLLKFKKLKYYE